MTPSATLTTSRVLPADREQLDLAGEMEAALLDKPQVECPVVHRFAPNCYIRQVSMPAATFVVGHQHKTEHFNIILQGTALVSINGVVKEVRAGDTFVSGAGVRKVLLVLEDMVWQTVHVIDTTGMENLSQLTSEQAEALSLEMAPGIIDESQQSLDYKALIAEDQKKLEAELVE